MKVTLKNKNDLKQIMQYLKTNYTDPVNNDNDLYDELYFGYDDFCDKVGLILADIDSKVVGKELYNMHNVANSDCRTFAYWQFLDGDIEFKTLIDVIKECSNKQIIEL